MRPRRRRGGGRGGGDRTRSNRDGDRDKEKDEDEDEDKDCIPGTPRIVIPGVPSGTLPRRKEEEEEEKENKEEEEDEKETGTPGAQALVVSSVQTRASPFDAALRVLHCGWAATVREAPRSEPRSRTRRGGVRANVAHL